MLSEASAGFVSAVSGSLGLMLLMVHGKVQLYIPTEQAGDGYDYISWAGVAKTGEMVYYSVSENYGNGGNYISSIKPGESVQESNSQLALTTPFVSRANTFNSA